MRMYEPPKQSCEMCSKRSEMQFHRAAHSMPDGWAVAMAYVPMQTDTTVYDEMQALCSGTLFPALNKPFKRGCRQ